MPCESHFHDTRQTHETRTAPSQHLPSLYSKRGTGRAVRTTTGRSAGISGARTLPKRRSNSAMVLAVCMRISCLTAQANASTFDYSCLQRRRTHASMFFGGCFMEDDEPKGKA